MSTQPRCKLEATQDLHHLYGRDVATSEDTQAGFSAAHTQQVSFLISLFSVVLGS